MPSSQTLAMAGIVLCLYALYVEYKTSHPADNANETFTALCDSEAIGASCSAVFQLPQSHLMSYLGIVSEDSIANVPNAALGLLYYTYQLWSTKIVLDRPQGRWLRLLRVVIASAAVSSSLFLAHHLTLLSELCVFRVGRPTSLNAALLHNFRAALAV